MKIPVMLSRMKYNLLAGAQCIGILVLVNNTDPTWITVSIFAVLMLGVSYCSWRTIK